MATEKKAKAPAKKTIPATSNRSTSSTAVEKNTPVSFKIKKPYLISGIVIILVVALLYYFKSLFVVALVNGQPITRIALIQQLEKQGGKQVLNIAVTKMLIEQEAKKKNITVAQKDIDAEVKKIETSLASQGQTLDQALAAQGMTKQDYTDQVRLQILIDKLVGKDIQVSDKEVADYIETNKSAFPEGSNMDEIKKNVKDQLRQQKLSEKVQTWIADLQKKAQINYFLTY